MIERTEAVVLRTIDYGETSKIVTLYTRGSGKIGVMAKGARSQKSSFGGTLEPLAYLDVVYYYKSSRELQTLKESSYVRPFQAIGSDLEKLNVGMRIVELTNILMYQEEADPTAFELLRTVLAYLNETDRHPANLWPYFQLRMAELQGFAPDIDRESLESVPEGGGTFDLRNGAVLPPGSSAGEGRRASRTALRAFAIYAKAELPTIMRMQVQPETYREVQELIRGYLRTHVEHLRPSKSRRVFEQMVDISQTLPEA